MTPIPSKGEQDFQSASNRDDRLGLPVDDDRVYERFAAWLDGQLDELVAKWAHLAAPRASRRERAIQRARR